MGIRASRSAARTSNSTAVIRASPSKPLLNHVAVLVDEVDPVIAEAEKREIVDNVVDAANTLAVFVWGPERVRIEYVEHKPGFALQ